MGLFDEHPKSQTHRLGLPRRPQIAESPARRATKATCQQLHSVAKGACSSTPQKTVQTRRFERLCVWPRKLFDWSIGQPCKLCHRQIQNPHLSSTPRMTGRGREGSTVQRKRSHVAPGELKVPLLSDQHKEGVRPGCARGATRCFLH